MKQETRPAQDGPVRRMLLVGGGHAQIEVLRRLALAPRPALKVTLVARERLAPYSGMLPGVVAGAYAPPQAHVDLDGLCRQAGADLVHASATAIDPVARRVTVTGIGELAYDLLSIDVGITPRLDDIPGARENAVPVKPISGFLPRIEAALAPLRAAGAPAGHVAVIGGGAAGFELVLAVLARLRRDGPGRPGATLVAGGGLLPGLPHRALRLARAALDRAGVHLVEGDRAARIEAGRVHLASGATIAADAILVSTRAAAPGWLAQGGLSCDADGFLALHPTLQLLNDGRILAAGDCATVIAYPRPRAGVFAVRQGPVLADNLLRLADGKAPRAFRPQRRHLMLLSTSDGRAIAIRGSLVAEGRWAWRWKDRIDRRFMARYGVPTS